MGLFSRKTIFHVEDSLPDPEELRWRFRRRILLVAMATFVTFLLIPLVKDLKYILLARAEAKQFASIIQETRVLASQTRHPVSLTLGDASQDWTRQFHLESETCGDPAPGPTQVWLNPSLRWKLQGQKSDGSTLAGRNLCLHPRRGLLLDGVPLEGGQLLLSLYLTNDDVWQTNPTTYLLLTDSGTEIQTVDAVP